MASIFLTGATGYIGGDVLNALATAHPDYTIRALVRNDAHRDVISKKYPNVQVVGGSLDDAETIAREAVEATVVLNLASTSHLDSVQAIHKTLAGRDGETSYWIQISGASLLAAGELADKNFTPGEPSDTIFDDLDGVADIHDIVRRHPARAVDNFILFTAANAPSINTALVIPPIIYGRGRGPANQRSMQIPDLAKATIERGRGLQLGRGQSRWGNVHVQDLSDLFVKLVEKAVAGISDERIWNANGLYLTGVGELTFEEISRKVTAVAVEQGLIPARDVETLSPQELDSILHRATALYGTNARSKARRAKELLNWTPNHVSLEDDVTRTVELEVARLDEEE
ncbi:hypothetical protein F5X68DRAFT_201453 [Plectosphaerella plurivora]|uniref:NmrA-like domain-containing protein n=1 Tax=Plectosphaerella plurivora TaxID=936078 RepID=A0A9P9ADN4_9PEZI|nr:hypothetical protein F5X68DRAFT_201453 [Plectosphaerella plurivora]